MDKEPLDDGAKRDDQLPTPSGTWLNRNVVGMGLTVCLSDAGQRRRRRSCPASWRHSGPPRSPWASSRAFRTPLRSFVKLGAGWWGDRGRASQGDRHGGYALTGAGHGAVRPRHWAGRSSCSRGPGLVRHSGSGARCATPCWPSPSPRGPRQGVRLPPRRRHGRGHHRPAGRGGPSLPRAALLGWERHRLLPPYLSADPCSGTRLGGGFRPAGAGEAPGRQPRAPLLGLHPRCPPTTAVSSWGSACSARAISPPPSSSPPR